MSVREYRQKRRFGVTPEPFGSKRARRSHKGLAYVVHKHQASRLHYDFRLEWQGVLFSWAIPKGPSLDPSVKRMAIQTEDHPQEYARFEGVIPVGEYGGGTVMVWDHGVWIPEDDDVDAALRKGALKFTLKGRKLKGSWVLVRMAARGAERKPGWLLLKHRDRFAKAEDILRSLPRSSLSRRLLVEIARDEGGSVESAARGDPPKALRRLIRNPRRTVRGRSGKATNRQSFGEAEGGRRESKRENVG